MNTLHYADKSQMDFKKHLKPFWEKYKVPISFVIGAIVSTSIIKGCDLIVEKIKESPREYSIVLEECFDGQPMSDGDDKKLWRCPVTVKNETGKERVLKVSCTVAPGNFYESPALIARGGGVTQNTSPNCFDNLNNSKKECLVALQQDEYIKLEFKAVSYDQPTNDCSSDTF